MERRQQLRRAKAWGREVEHQALRELRIIWPKLERTGASAQKTRGYPDLVQRASRESDFPVRVIVTKDRGRQRPLLATLSVDDLVMVATFDVRDLPVYVQVKGRASSTIGRLYEELAEFVD